MAVISPFPNRAQEPDTDTLGGRLSRLREAQGINLTALARRVGVPKRTILDWESDRAEPSVEKLKLLGGILNASLMWLLHGVGEAPADEIGPDPRASLTMQIERLRRIHEDTGLIIERLGREIQRLDDED